MARNSMRESGMRVILGSLSEPLLGERELIDSIVSYYIDYKEAYYSEILSILYELKKGNLESLDMISMRLRDILVSEFLEEICEKSCENCSDRDFRDFKVFLKKLQDYFDSEYLRIQNSKHDMMEVMKSELDTLREYTKKQEEEFKQKQEKHEEKMSNLEQNTIGQITGVLGIFAGIIFAFVGGVNAFAAILTNLNNLSAHRMIFIVFLFGLIFFDVCYVLIYAMSKITGKSIGSDVVLNYGQDCGVNGEGCYNFTSQEFNIMNFPELIDESNLDKKRKKVLQKENKNSTKENNFATFRKFIFLNFWKYLIFFSFNLLMLFGMLITVVFYYNTHIALATVLFLLIVLAFVFIRIFKAFM